MITEIVCAYYMRDEIVIDFTIFVFSERIDFTVLESSGAFVRSVLRFQRPKTSWGQLRGIRTIRRGSINGCRVGLAIPSCKQQLATCCRCDLRNFEQCGTVSRVDIWIYTYSSAVYFVLFHRLVVIDDNLALADTTMFFIAFLIERRQLVIISTFYFLCI